MPVRFGSRRLPVLATTETLPFSDVFGRPDGVLGNNWIAGAFWALASNKATCTPTGSELITNGDMEIDAGWSAINAPATNELSEEQKHAGTYSRKLVIAATGGVQQTSLGVAGWAVYTCWLYVTAGSAYLTLGGTGSTSVSATSTWTKLVMGRRLTGAGNAAILALSASSTWYADDASLFQPAFADLIATRPPTTADVTAQVTLTTPYRTAAGLVLNVDSPTNPQNCVVVYIDYAGGTSATVKVDKLVEGTWSQVSSTTIAYAAAQVLRVAKLGSSYQVTYKGAVVGATNTIDDASIVNNTRHGLFSTCGDNLLADLTIEQTACLHIDTVQAAWADYAGFPADDDFTVVFIPDPQYYTRDSESTFEDECTWINTQIAGLNVQMVLGAGDLVDAVGNATQWTNANAALAILQGADTPNLWSIGNHDYDDVSAKTATTYNTHVPQSYYTGKAWWDGGFYEAGHSENKYQLLTIGTLDWLFLELEYNPRPAVIAWADGILRTYSTRLAILLTHDYVDHLGALDDEGGQAIWNALSGRPNLILACSGHVPGKANRQDYASDCHVCHAFVLAHNEEGEGPLRVLRIRPSTRQILYEKYRVVTGSYDTDTGDRYLWTY